MASTGRLKPPVIPVVLRINIVKPYKFLPFVILFLILIATSAYSLELGEYTIIKEMLPIEKGVAVKWQNYIQFTGVKTKIRMARTLKRDTGEYIMCRTDQGFDEKTLKVSWLHKPDLIWIRWQTYARCDAGYEYDGHIILKNMNGNLLELFRHNYDAYWYRGGCTNYRQKLSMSYYQTARTLKLKMNRHSKECGIKADQTPYFENNDVISIWQYKLDNASLRFISGQQITERNQKSSIEELKSDSYDGLYGINKKLE